jgi:PAS domain S-box-containing protein
MQKGGKHHHCRRARGLGLDRTSFRRTNPWEFRFAIDRRKHQTPSSESKVLNSAMDSEMDKRAAQRSSDKGFGDLPDGLDPLVVAVETTRMPMIFTNAKAAGNPIIFANDSFLKLLRYRRDEVLGVAFETLLAIQTTSDDFAKVREVLDSSTQEITPEVHFAREDGTEVWAAVHVVPVRARDGNLYQHFISFVDRTEHKKEQRQLMMLVEELNHRVKNTLAAVQAIVLQGIRSALSLSQAKDAISGRLLALSRSHSLLSRRQWANAGVRDIVRDALEPFGIKDGRAERFNVSGTNFHVSPNATVALSTVINELATNAVKYGAFSNDEGSVVITLSIEPSPEGEQFILHWSEVGGPRVKPPASRGVGTKTIESGLPYQLGGSVDLIYAPEGLQCIYKVRASKLVTGSTSLPEGFVRNTDGDALHAARS